MSTSILLIIETAERHTEIDLRDADAAAIHIESCVVPHLAPEFATIIVHRSVVMPVPDRGVARVFLQMEVPSEAVAGGSQRSPAGSSITQYIERCAGPIVRQLLGRTTRFEVLVNADAVVSKPGAASISVKTRRSHWPR